MVLKNEFPISFCFFTRMITCNCNSADEVVSVLYICALTGSHFSRQNLTMTLNRTIWLSGNLKAVNVEIKERLSAGSFNSAGKVAGSVGQPDWSRRRYDESPDALLATRCPAAMS
jgi:hypothetical protein